MKSKKLINESSICNMDCLHCKYSDCINDAPATREEVLYSEYLDDQLVFERLGLNLRKWVRGGYSEYYRLNRDERLNYGRIYYSKHREERLSYGKEYYQMHKDRARAYYLRNRERINEYAKARYRKMKCLE